jgi:hypothetical protein
VVIYNEEKPSFEMERPQTPNSISRKRMEVWKMGGKSYEVKFNFYFYLLID